MEVKTLTAEDWQRWWESLKWLDRSRVGAASARAFSWLWLHRHGQPGILTFYLPELAERFGKSLRAAQDWIDRLQAAELVYVTNRSVRATVPEDHVVVDVYHPNPAIRGRANRVDPQRQFGFMAIAADHQRKPPGVSARKPPGVSARKPRGFRKTASVAAIAEAAGSMQLSMGQAIRQVAESIDAGRGPPQRKVLARDLRDIRYQKSRNLRYLDLSNGRAKSQQEYVDDLIEIVGPDLHLGPARKMAQKLAEGLVSEETVNEILCNGRRKAKNKTFPLWRYVVNAFQTCFEENGWPWRKE